MSDSIIVALLSLLGTIGGSLGGVVISSKLTDFRLRRLEQKVDEHNNFGRLIPVMQEQIRNLYSTVAALQAYHAHEK